MVARLDRGKVGTVLLLALSAMISSGCSDEGGDAPTGQALVGAWAPVEGDLFAFFPGAEFLVLEFYEQGYGVATFREPHTNALACLDFIHSPLGDNTVFIDVEVFSEGALFLAKSYVYDIRGDTLGLGDTSGRRQIFTKVSAPPEGSECIRLDATIVGDGVEADPRFGTGLVSDGADLWFGANVSSDEVLISVNPFDGMVGTPLIRPSGLVNVHAYDGSLFWLRHPSGIIATGRDLADVEVDSIDTETDLGHELEIRSMAWDGAHLWLAGEEASDDNRELLEVDPVTKTLVNRYDFNLDLQAMSWGAESLWAIVDDSPSPIVEIDIDTQEVIRTYEIPGYSPISHAYRGLAAVGEDVYVLFEEQLTGSRRATIVRVAP